MTIFDVMKKRGLNMTADGKADDLCHTTVETAEASRDILGYAMAVNDGRTVTLVKENDDETRA